MLSIDRMRRTRGKKKGGDVTPFAANNTLLNNNIMSKTRKNVQAVNQQNIHLDFINAATPQAANAAANAAPANVKAVNLPAVNNNTRKKSPVPISTRKIRANSNSNKKPDAREIMNKFVSIWGTLNAYLPKVCKVLYNYDVKHSTLCKNIYEYNQKIENLQNDIKNIANNIQRFYSVKVVSKARIDRKISKIVDLINNIYDKIQLIGTIVSKNKIIFITNYSMLLFNGTIEHRPSINKPNSKPILLECEKEATQIINEFIQTAKSIRRY